jgi:hypothetical protein
MTAIETANYPVEFSWSAFNIATILIHGQLCGVHYQYQSLEDREAISDPQMEQSAAV